MSAIQEASRLLLSGYACSQAVFVACGEPLGVPRELALRISSGFAGGMRTASTCGAVTGAIMALGMRYGDGECATGAERARVYKAVREFSEEFRRRHGSLLCRELLGCDTSTPEGRSRANELNLFETRCVALVEGAVALLEEMENREAL
ncbi:MAG: C_GCAxxG_C_C family protein [Fretibacterium sp.]|nr:C_GCAxxG_C_C family protein [Fretibacterium sp.]